MIWPTNCSMNYLIWNCRGASKPSTHAYCHRMMMKVSLVILLETQLSGRGVNKAINQLPKDMRIFVIPALGRSGD